MKELETRVVDIDVDDIRNKMESLGAIKVKSEDKLMKYTTLKMVDF